jgi:hypothetical protein
VIPLIDGNSYLKNVYESRNVLEKIPLVFIEYENFLIEDIKFGVKRLANGKDKDIK